MCVCVCVFAHTPACLASSGERPGFLLNTPQHTGWSPQQSSLSQSVPCAEAGHSGLGPAGVGLAVTSLVQRGVEVEGGLAGGGGHRARDASASAKPFLQGERSAQHLAGWARGQRGIHPTVTGIAARITPAPHRSWRSANTSQRQS